MSVAPRGELVRDPEEPGGEEVGAGRFRKQHVAAAAASAAGRGEGEHGEGAGRLSALHTDGATAASAISGERRSSTRRTTSVLLAEPRSAWLSTDFTLRERRRKGCRRGDRAAPDRGEATAGAHEERGGARGTSKAVPSETLAHNPCESTQSPSSKNVPPSRSRDTGDEDRRCRHAPRDGLPSAQKRFNSTRRLSAARATRSGTTR